MTKLLIDESPLMFSPTLACLIGDRQAIALQQLHFWLENKDQRGRRTAHLRDGRYWIYNSYPQWRKGNFRMWSEPTIKRIMLFLEQHGIVESRQFGSRDGQMSKWYTIDYARFNEIVTHGGVLKRTGTSQSLPDEIDEIAADLPAHSPTDQPAEAPAAHALTLLTFIEDADPPDQIDLMGASDQIDLITGSNCAVLPITENTTEINSQATLEAARAEAARAERIRQTDEVLRTHPDPVGFLVTRAVEGGVEVTSELVHDAERITVAQRLANGSLERLPCDQERQSDDHHHRDDPRDTPGHYVRACMGGLRAIVRTVTDEAAQGHAAKLLWADGWTVNQVLDCLKWRVSHGDPRFRESLLTVAKTIGSYYATLASKNEREMKREYEQTGGNEPRPTDGRSTEPHTFEDRAAVNYAGYFSEPATDSATETPDGSARATAGGQSNRLKLVVPPD